MFGRKQSADDNNKDQNVDLKHVNIMPSEFYGGKDPVIYPKQHAKPPKQKMLKEEPKKTATPPPTTQPTNTPVHPTLHRKLIIILAVFLLIGLGGIVWYQLNQYQQAQQVNTPVDTPPVPTQPTEPRDTTPDTPPVATTTIQEQAPATSTEPLLSDDVGIQFPRTQLVRAIDIDADDLSDLEEEYFSTDSGTADTDEDGYFDGLEIRNLYSPRAAAPARLIDSGLVQEYVHPQLQYRLYVPNNWDVSAVDASGDQTLISAISGDYVEVLVVPKQFGEPFTDWFAREATAQRFNDISEKTNRFSIPFFTRQDGLVAYIEDEAVVYVLLYRSADERQIRFGEIMEMMVQSFRPANRGVALPIQDVLPSEDGIIAPTTSTVSSTEASQ